MEKVLTESSDVTCGHGGKVSTSGSKKLTVNRKRVLLKDGIKGKKVNSDECSNLEDKSKGLEKCQAVESISKGEASKLTIDGKYGVMLESIKGLTKGKPPGTLSANANQTKLTAI